MAKATEWRNLQEALVAQGCTLKHERRHRHVKVYNQQGKLIGTISGTPGNNPRGYLNARAQFRRAGYTIN